MPMNRIPIIIVWEDGEIVVGFVNIVDDTHSKASSL
jgi:hypothetical protein